METEPTKARVMILDSDDAVLFALTKQIEAQGMAVDAARSFDQAMALLSARTYTGVISDMSPSGNESDEGLEIAEYVSTHHPQAKVILMTTEACAETIKRACHAGASACLEKPIHFEAIRHELQRGPALCCAATSP